MMALYPPGRMMALYTPGRIPWAYDGSLPPWAYDGSVPPLGVCSVPPGRMKTLSPLGVRWLYAPCGYDGSVPPWAYDGSAPGRMMALYPQNRYNGYPNPEVPKDAHFWESPGTPKIVTPTPKCPRMLTFGVPPAAT